MGYQRRLEDWIAWTGGSFGGNGALQGPNTDCGGRVNGFIIAILVVVRRDAGKHFVVYRRAGPVTAADFSDRSETG